MYVGTKRFHFLELRTSHFVSFPTGNVLLNGKRPLPTANVLLNGKRPRPTGNVILKGKRPLRAAQRVSCGGGRTQGDMIMGRVGPPQKTWQMDLPAGSFWGPEPRPLGGATGPQAVGGAI